MLKTNGLPIEKITLEINCNDLDEIDLSRVLCQMADRFIQGQKPTWIKNDTGEKIIGTIEYVLKDEVKNKFYHF
jgi:hypothetical protein